MENMAHADPKDCCCPGPQKQAEKQKHMCSVSPTKRCFQLVLMGTKNMFWLVKQKFQVLNHQFFPAKSHHFFPSKLSPRYWESNCRAGRSWPHLGAVFVAAKSTLFLVYWGGTYPLVMSKQLLKMTIEIVDFPSYKMVIFQFVMLVYQRAYYKHGRNGRLFETYGKYGTCWNNWWENIGNSGNI